MGTPYAATLSPVEGNPGVVAFSGPIQPGDADALVKWIKRDPITGAIVVNSLGGSVAEAIRISQVVTKASLSISVSKDGKCASACFFIFAAGVGRDAAPSELMGDARSVSGFVGLHRPFQANLSSPDNSQSQIMKRVSSYLEDQMVPRRLIDLMMTRPSNEIYWLTEEDLMQLGDYPPPVEEFLIQKCGYFRQYSRLRRGNADDKARLKSIIGCIGQETAIIGAEGIAAISAGWMPEKAPLSKQRAR
jgi:hypothetical protein